MIRLALKSEYNFRKTFMHMAEIKDYVIGDSIGIADINGCYSHPYIEKICKANKLKTIYAVRLSVVKDATIKEKPRGSFGVEFIFIAKNYDGVVEINELVGKSIENFYYRPNISYIDVNSLSSNVVVISKEVCPCRIDFIGIDLTNIDRYKHLDNIVYVDNNYYPVKEDKAVYECLASPRFENQTYPQHILTIEEINYYFPKCAIDNTDLISSMCEDIVMKQAETTVYTGNDNIVEWITNGAIDRGIDLSKEPYKSRIKYELDLIESKHYVDYFLMNADLIRYSKSKMYVGPGRGSSSGSLVAFCMGIVDVDPVKYGLIFERFIASDRFDPPDIDTDYNDKLRVKAIKYLADTYGHSKVKHISNLSKLKAKSAITEFAKALDIPPFETIALKDSIIVRSSGDRRVNDTLIDTLKGTESGKAFIEKYPEMMVLGRIEGHSSHTSVHAAGIIVCNDKLTDYITVGSASANIKNRTTVIQCDKKAAENRGLLKIDMLGLRTLTILQDVAEMAGFDYNEYARFKLDDPKVFDIFNNMRLSGIFQFEGEALQMVTSKMGVKNFYDICAITSLGRPGSLNSGGTDRFVKYRTGKEVPVYLSDKHKEITEETYGIVIYQETMMNIVRDIAGLTWKQVSQIRRISSKSMGDETMAEFKDTFINGCLAMNETEETAEALWKDIASAGSWIFNKSHAISYAMISYYCAWAKTYHILEFVAANLNNAKSPESALRILRDAVMYDGVDYVHIDVDNSIERWQVVDGKLIGSLTDLPGVGLTKAKNIMGARKGYKKWTPSMIKMMDNPVTIFSILYPTKYHWGDLYKNSKDYGLKYKPINISEVGDKGSSYIIGCLTSIDLRDINDAEAIARRDGRTVDGQPMYVNFKIEDDTGMMFCVVERRSFARFGKMILDAKEGEDWFCVKGEISVNLGWKRVYVKGLVNLNNSIGLTPYDDKLALENRNA